MKRLIFSLILVSMSIGASPVTKNKYDFKSDPFFTSCSEYECSLHWMGVDYCKGPGESVSTPACTFTCWCGDSGDCLWWTSDC